LAGTLILGVFLAPCLATAKALDELIAYPTGGGEEPYVIRTVKPDGTDNRRLIGPRDGLFRLGPSSPEWSPDGKKLLFGGHFRYDSAAQSLWYSTASGKRIRRIHLGLRGPRTGPGAITLHGWDWAPDGRRIVFATRKGPAAPLLYTISIDGRHRRSLHRGWWPEWSSDGRYILFSLPVGDQFVDVRSGRIAVVRPDGSGFRMLTESSSESAPTFSPDGRRVLFVHSEATFNEDWRVVDVTGRHEVIVGPDRRPSDLGYCEPHWTPDGTRLAVVALESGTATDPRDGASFVTMRLTGAHVRVAFTFPRGSFGWQTICDFSWRPQGLAAGSLDGPLRALIANPVRDRAAGDEGRLSANRRWRAARR
jgi:Tol biopolymer transport system component